MKDIFEAVKIAVKALDSKKADDIKVIKTAGITDLAEYIIICTGSSSTKIKTLADLAEVTLAEAGEEVLHREGYMEGNWVLLDYGAFIINVFNSKTREFYALEQLWQNGEEIDISDIVTPEE